MRTALVALGIAAALVASGSATVAQARAAGMAAIPAVALVVLLEVINVAGTWTWMVDDRTRVQWEAGVGVGVASFVTGACGLAEYSWLGIVPAVGVLFTVHLVGRLSHRSTPVDNGISESVVDQEPIDQPTTVDHEPVDEGYTVNPSSGPVPARDKPESFAGLREASRVEWPPPHVEPPVTLHVAGYTDPIPVPTPTEMIDRYREHVMPFVEPCPTEPLLRSVRLDESVPVDVHDETVDRESWRDHMPTEAEYAAVILDHLPRDGRRLSEAGLHEALAVVCPAATKYRAKKYLGNVTTRHRAAGEEATG